MDFFSGNKNKIYKYVFIAGTVLLIYLTANYFFSYIAPFVFGYLFSLMMEPLARFIIKKTKRGRALAAVICVLLLTVVMVFLSSGIVSQLLQQGMSFISFTITFINSLPDVISGFQSNYMDYISFLPEEFHAALNDMFSGILSMIASSLGALLRTGTGNVASLVASFLLGTLLSIISTFFFIKDKFIIREFIKTNAPGWFVNIYRSVKTGVAGAFLGYMKSQLILMAPTFVICFTGLTFIAYPYALFVGMLIAFLDMLPMLGAGMILGPWTLISFLTGNFVTGVVLAVMYVVIVITRQIIEPKVMGQQIGVHPLLTLMSIYIGLRVFGIFGFIIGPMTVVILKALVFSEIIISEDAAPEKNAEDAEANGPEGPGE